MFYVFLAEGFEETEALAPVDVMRRAKLDVKTVGVTGECVTSSHGVPVKADITIDNIDLDDVQGVVLTGGMPGTLNLEANEKVIEAVKYSCENGKIVAAICAAPSILGHLGILDGKKATCFPCFFYENMQKAAEAAGACQKMLLTRSQTENAAPVFRLKILRAAARRICLQTAHKFCTCGTGRFARRSRRRAEPIGSLSSARG